MPHIHSTLLRYFTVILDIGYEFYSQLFFLLSTSIWGKFNYSGFIYNEFLIHICIIMVSLFTLFPSLLLPRSWAAFRGSLLPQSPFSNQEALFSFFFLTFFVVFHLPALFDRLATFQWSIALGCYLWACEYRTIDVCLLVLFYFVCRYWVGGWRNIMRMWLAIEDMSVLF